MNEARIAALNLYPVKGCRGITLPEATLATTGIVAAGVGDREWMIVDANENFVSQRQLPRLALLVVAIAGDELQFTAASEHSGAPPLSIPLARKRAAAREVQVWNSHVRGWDEGDAAAAWLTAFLGVPVRLVRFDRTLPRHCNPEYAGDSGAHTMFADAFPYLVIGEASLADLNARLTGRGGAALPMDRFRPNLVVEGLDAFAEDHVDTVECEGIVLRLVKRCVRCQVTTTDQQTALVGAEPLRTLGEYRMDALLGGVTFGMNAVILAGSGRPLRTGAAMRVSYRF